MEFHYSLEDAKGNTILSAKPTLDEVVKYLDEHITSATQYRVVLVRSNSPDIVLYTRTESLPDTNNNTTRKVFNLDG
jgi:hypothetical protein